MDADGRYGMLIERVLKAEAPLVAGGPPPEPKPVFPVEVEVALEEFASDPDLHAHNARWARQALALGEKPEEIAKAIRYGDMGENDVMAVLS